MRLRGSPNIERLRAHRDVAGLVKALENKNGDVRRQAAVALGELDTGAAVEPLIAALDDPDQTVRSEAARSLGVVGDVRAIEPLVRALADPGTVDRAAEALGKLRDARAVEPLIGVLSRDRPYGKRVAAEVLGDLGDARAVEPLIEVADDPDLMLTAVRALCRIGTPRAAEEIRSRLVLLDGLDVLHATTALMEMGERFDLEPLMWAAERATHSGETVFRSMVLEALAATREPVAIDYLIEDLLDRSDLNQRNRLANRKALVQCPDRSLVLSRLVGALGRTATRGDADPHLSVGLGEAAWILNDFVTRDVDRLSDEELLTIVGIRDRPGRAGEKVRSVSFHKVREQAERELARRSGTLQEPPTVDELAARGDLAGLVAASKSKKKDMRRQAIAALEHVDMVEALIHPDPAVRLHAIGAIESRTILEPDRIDVRAVEPLITALDDDDGRVRRVTVPALGRISRLLGGQASAALLGALSHDDPGVRAEVVDVLGESGETRVIGPLLGAMNDVEPSVRKSVVSALCVLGQKLQDPRLREALTTMLGDDDPSVREAAAQRLLWLGVPGDEIEAARRRLPET